MTPFDKRVKRLSSQWGGGCALGAMLPRPGSRACPSAAPTPSSRPSSGCGGWSRCSWWVLCPLQREGAGDLKENALPSGHTALGSQLNRRPTPDPAQPLAWPLDRPAACSIVRLGNKATLPN